MTEQKTSSRRALMKGVAWAAPVAAVAVAAPAYAVSYPVTITLDPTKSCKDAAGPDNNYYLYFNIHNNTGTPVTYTVTSLIVRPNSGSPITFPDAPGGTIPVGGDSDWGLCSNLADDMANGTAEIRVRVTGQGIDNTVPATFEISSLPPCSQLGIDPCPK